MPYSIVKFTHSKGRKNSKTLSLTLTLILLEVQHVLLLKKSMLKIFLTSLLSLKTKGIAWCNSPKRILQEEIHSFVSSIRTSTSWPQPPRLKNYSKRILLSMTWLNFQTSCQLNLKRRVISKKLQREMTVLLSFNTILAISWWNV